MKNAKVKNMEKPKWMLTIQTKKNNNAMCGLKIYVEFVYMTKISQKLEGNK